MSFSPYFSCYTLLLVMPHNLLLLYMSLLSLSFLAWLAVTVEGGGGCRGLRYSCFPCLACICVHLFVLVNLFLCALRFLSLSWHIMFTILNMYIVLFLSLLIPIQLCSHPDMCNLLFPISLHFLSIRALGNRSPWWWRAAFASSTCTVKLSIDNPLL